MSECFLKNKTYYYLNITFICILIIFIGLQFGLVYEDLEQLSYIPNLCTFEDIHIVKRYSCGLDCSLCKDFNGSICSLDIENNNKLNPDLCLSSNNTKIQNCPYLGECSNGYKCCKKHCVYGWKGVRSCRCVDFVKNDQCTVNCDILFTLNMNIIYQNQEINFNNFSYTKDYKKDIDLLNQDILKYNMTLTCFHNKRNTKIIFDKSINTVNFIFYGIFATLLFILILIYCYYILEKLIDMKLNIDKF